MYLLNSLIVPIEGGSAEFKIKRISLEEARNIVDNAQQVVSAIGHQATANILTSLLGIPVQVNRISVFFKPGDEAIAIVLRQRLQEGQIIQNVEELQKIGYDLYHIVRVR